jgi:predicted AlkP superfamily phosphohydrolase/phosphomutase
MEDHPCDFWMFHFQATDVLQHALWKLVDQSHPRYEAEAATRFAPAFKAIYQSIDECIGRMVDRLSEGGTVFVMSDHGFGPLHNTVNLNLFLLNQGLMKLKRGAWTQLKAGLFRAGITPASIWHLIESVGLQNYVWQVSKSARNRVVSKFLSFDDVDWSRTVAYSIGHVGQIYVNLRGREPQGIVERGPEYEAVRREVIDALQELRHPRTGKGMVDEVIPGDEVVHGPYASRSADLHLVLDGYRAIAFPLFAADRRVVTRQIRGDSGCHRRHGVLIAWGDGIRAGEIATGAHIMDLTPTILHLMRLPVPDDMDGRVLTSLLELDYPVEYQRSESAEAAADKGLSAGEAAEVEERLRSLGYLG